MRLLARLALLAALSLALALPPALGGGGDPLQRTYEVASVNFEVHTGDGLGATDDGSVDVGAVVFPAHLFPLGSTLRDAAVADALSPRARAVACQDLDLDAVCGETAAEELRIEYCDSFADPANVLVANGQPFAPLNPLTVFVFASPVRLSTANPGSTGLALCPAGAVGAATTGTVTVLLGP